MKNDKKCAEWRKKKKDTEWPIAKKIQKRYRMKITIKDTGIFNYSNTLLLSQNYNFKKTLKQDIKKKQHINIT